MIKRATHNNKTIAFSEILHTYTLDDSSQQFISGTQFIGKYFPTFDKEKWSAFVADRDGITIEQVLEKWDKEKVRGTTSGTNVHLYAEKLIEGKQNLPLPSSDREKKLFYKVNIAVVALLKNFKFIEAEKIVFSPNLGVAGTIDLLMFDPATLTVIILDWKQNKKISKVNNYDSALYPIDHLEDTDLNKYAMQLNLYQRILEEESYFPGATGGFKRVLVHLTSDYSIKNKIIKLPDMQVEINNMLKNYFYKESITAWKK